MGTTADKLNKLLDTKSSIKSALVAKGQSVSDNDTFASYAEKIRAIPSPADGTAGITASDDGAGNVTITMIGVSGISV